MDKMHMLCVIALCLATLSLSARQYTWVDVCLEMTEPEVVRIQKEMKDAAKRRQHMKKLLLASHSNTDMPKVVEMVKQKFSLSEKVMQDELMAIIRESGKKNGWKKRQGPDAPLDLAADTQIYWGLYWMCYCADMEGKKFLLEIATDNA